MTKLYNTQEDISSNLQKFFKYIFPDISKNHLKILPNIIIGLIDAESVVTTDITIKLKGDFLNVKFESVERRIRRFLNNTKFNAKDLYDSIIKNIISLFKSKHSDNRIHISFDHMFINDKFTTLAFSLRIGKQGIPLWFKSFKGKNDPDAFSNYLIFEVIDYIYNLFKDKNYNLIFLADRWFNNTKIMKYIESINCTYCIRIKDNNLVTISDKPDQIEAPLSIVKPTKHKSKHLFNVPLTYSKHIVNIAISTSLNTDDPWYIATNGDPNRAIKDYSYRFGSIECIFKNLKSNGFYLESTAIKNLQAFSTMFTILNISIIWLTILGCTYSKNKKSATCNVRDTKKIKGSIKRCISFFNLGLTLFNLAYNSSKNIKLKFDFLLYDI